MKDEKTKKAPSPLAQLLLIGFGYSIVYNIVSAGLCAFDKQACGMEDSFGGFMLGFMLLIAVFTTYGIAKKVYKFVKRYRAKRRATIQ